MSSGSAVIAHWSEVCEGHGPDDVAVRLLAERRRRARERYDPWAVRRAYRQAIQRALPDGVDLRENTFHGPAQGLRLEDGRLVDADGRTLLQRYRDALERAVNGPDGDREAYFWQIADRHRRSTNGRKSYGDWRVFAGRDTVEDSVRAALGPWGQDHVQELIDSGRHPIEALRAALTGEFGTQTDVDQVAALYRAAIAEALPTGFTLDDNEVWGPFPPVEADVKGAVAGVDLDAVITAYATAPRELLTAQEVATVIGAASADSARHTLSRWGVAAAEYRTTETGKVQARYDGDQVRTAWRSRPGRGRRTRPADS